jgi:putative tricarboxylic transport membrane protein
MALVVMPVVLFGLSLRALGLLPILVVVVLATAWASRYASLKASVLLAVGIAAFCSLLFIKALGLPLPLLGPLPLVSTILGLDSWLAGPATAPAQ